MIIAPTVGRVVLFRPGIRDSERMSVLDGAPPMRADVIFVWHDRLVNLLVTDHSGTTFYRPSVTLLQEGDAAPTTDSYCEWMEYQKGQAAKYEALEKEAQGRA